MSATAHQKLEKAQQEVERRKFTGHLNVNVILPLLVEVLTELVPPKKIEHPSPELEGAMNNLFQAFDAHMEACTPESFDLLTARIEELREVGSLVIAGEPR